MQDKIDEHALIAAMQELGSTKEEAEKLAIDIISGYGFSIKAKNASDARHIIKLFRDAGVRIKSAHESRNY